MELILPCHLRFLSFSYYKTRKNNNIVQFACLFAFLPFTYYEMRKTISISFYYFSQMTMLSVLKRKIFGIFDCH